MLNLIYLQDLCRCQCKRQKSYRYSIVSRHFWTVNYPASTQFVLSLKAAVRSSEKTVDLAWKFEQAHLHDRLPSAALQLLPHRGACPEHAALKPLHTPSEAKQSMCGCSTFVFAHTFHWQTAPSSWETPPFEVHLTAQVSLFYLFYFIVYFCTDSTTKQYHPQVADSAYTKASS